MKKVAPNGKKTSRQEDDTLKMLKKMQTYREKKPTMTELSLSWANMSDFQLAQINEQLVSAIRSTKGATPKLISVLEQRNEEQKQLSLAKSTSKPQTSRTSSKSKG